MGPVTATILTCAQPGCAHIARALIDIEGWLCWEHAPLAGWPEPDEPCSDDHDCGRSCYQDTGSFVYETTTIDGADVQCYCQCDHHA